METGLATAQARGLLDHHKGGVAGSRSNATMSTYDSSAVTGETADHSAEVDSGDKKQKKSKKEKKEKKSKKEKKHKEKKEHKSSKRSTSSSADHPEDELKGIEIHSGFNPQIAHLKPAPPAPWESTTPHTERTSTTMSSFGSNDVPPPVRMIECVDDEELQQAMLLGGDPRRASFTADSANSAPKEAAAYHGEMLQSFLRRHGQDDKLAIEQAMMFEAFLKSQQDALTHLTPTTADTAQSGSTIPQQKQEGFDDEEDTRLDHMESLLDDADSFADQWENGTFTSFTKSEGPMHKQRMMEQAQAFGSMRRNEDFMRRKEGDNSTGAKSAPAAIPAPPTLPRALGPGTTEIPQHMMKAPPPASDTDASSIDHDNKSISVDSNRSHGTNGSFNEPSLSGSLMSNLEERTIEEQISALSATQKSCFYSIKSTWEEGEGRSRPFTDEYYLRFCRCSPGKPFTAKTAMKIMRKFERRFLSLSVMGLENHLKTMAVFPAPGLKTAAGRNIFFMKMSRFSPKKSPISTMIDSVVYIMNCMLEKEKTCGDGLAVVADCTDFKMNNFSVAYASKLMMALQGRRNPTRVCLFLFVNPPSWFGSIYSTIMQPMMSEDFRKRVHRINEKDLKKYLSKGFEQFLPSELSTGKANSAELVKDFIVNRKQIEGQRLLESVNKG
mmetsp:Transcript_52763/g.78840  ORF Transcript_52763/g.78840 Transcript_52763/m.78840 type:complete len:667 (-) Transcript_52763:1055-3055(-)|eukprot:CAMPEP_0194048454 /NCGR_PEP_ID=MMETSP0009_2-20130614/27312_1 /TAXON_ID=210454 /ORGANISM="Grammatophora oceanica, Strain CCMP 410" /LENGTH=666 /DNA_ID=CAMNT_0038694315 /DNA_START=358 /DNA_END=2358 /DNA_ORIENTATION=-